VAIPTPVNGVITDTISQTNVSVLGQAPAAALANLYQASAQAFALMMQNAANAQQQMNITAQAVTAQGVVVLYASAAADVGRLGQSDVPDNMLELLTALRASSGRVPS
jgi:hypothetical protein